MQAAKEMLPLHVHTPRSFTVMRNTFLVSLLLALLSAFSLPTIAAPGKSGGDLPAAVVATEMASPTVNLNSADAATLAQELDGGVVGGLAYV